jgi:hypothetical protein
MGSNLGPARGYPDVSRDYSHPLPTSSEILLALHKDYFLPHTSNPIIYLSFNNPKIYSLSYRLHL